MERVLRWFIMTLKGQYTVSCLFYSEETRLLFGEGTSRLGYSLSGVPRCFAEIILCCRLRAEFSRWMQC